MSARNMALIGAVAILTSACASDPNRYPSLNIRDAERVSTIMVPAQGESAYTVAPAGETVLSEIGGLRATADRAHGQFLSRLDATRTAVGRARGADIESDAWASAQIAIADLESNRSEVLNALASLDKMFIAAHLEIESVTEIDAARSEVGAMVEAENAAINALLASLGA